jgi:hypothetical protein
MWPLRAPGASAPLPRSESELIQNRPAEHRDGVFPRRLLLPGERVLFETRPKLWGRLGWAVGIVAVLLGIQVLGAIALLLLALLVPSSGLDVGTTALTGTIGCVLFGAILYGLLRSRYKTAYALTNQRVLLVAGSLSSEFRFVAWPQVQRLYPPRDRSSSVTFEGQVSDPGRGAGAGRPYLLRWTGLRAGPRVYEFAQSAFLLEATRQTSRDRTFERRSELLARRIECAYCGNFIAVAEGGPLPRICPRCTAPLPATLAPAGAATVRRATAEPTLVEQLRPVVFLGQGALGWFRLVPIAWAIATVLLAGALVLGAAISGPQTSAAIALAATFAVVVAVAYGLWGQAVRKWFTVVRTLAASLSAKSPSRDRWVRPMRRRLGVAVAGFAGAVVLPPAALVAIILVATTAPPGPYPIFSEQLASLGILAGAFVAIVAGQWALITSFAEIASGSEIPTIVRGLAVGRRLAALGLFGGFALYAAIVVEVFATGFSLSAVALVLASLAGPAAVLLGLGRTERALRSWSDLAERVYSPSGGVAPGRWQTDGASTVGEAWTTPLSWIESGFAPGSWRRHRAEWSGVLLVTGTIAAVLLLSGTGWLGPSVRVAPFTIPPPAPPPTVIAAAGTTWNIPPQHYWYDRFRVNHTAEVSGTFNASGVVEVYVMDSLDYTRWQFVGRVISDQYASGNVTADQFQVRLGYADAFYVIIENNSPATTVDVTWASACLVVNGT